MRPTDWRAVLPLVALGDRDRDEVSPVHIIAQFREPKLSFGLSRGVGALFADGDLALRVAALLDALHPQPVFALPVWVSWLEREWETPFKLVLIDDDEQASRSAIRCAKGQRVPAARHIAGMVEDMLEVSEDVSSRVEMIPTDSRQSM
jgi:hypothetical protein